PASLAEAQLAYRQEWAFALRLSGIMQELTDALGAVENKRWAFVGTPAWLRYGKPGNVFGSEGYLRILAADAEFFLDARKHLFAQGFRFIEADVFTWRRFLNYRHHALLLRNEFVVDLSLKLHCCFAADFSSTSTACSTELLHTDGRQLPVLNDEYEMVYLLLLGYEMLCFGIPAHNTAIKTFLLLNAAAHKIEWDRFFEARRREYTERLCKVFLFAVISLFDCLDDFPMLGKHLAATPEALVMTKQLAGQSSNPERSGLPARLARYLRNAPVISRRGINDVVRSCWPEDVFQRYRVRASRRILNRAS
ncbi:MAG TPA: hypothetical protein PLP17_12405, partial [Oligoflexia bacterium]|nr:hypothetical protein [Oligoflexia bacterium]